MNVANLDRSLTFPHSVLGAKPEGRVVLGGGAYEELFGVAGSAEIAKFRLGKQLCYFVDHAEPSRSQVPLDSMSNDLWFQHAAIVVSDFEVACATVLAAGCSAISESPQTIPDWNEAAAGVRAFYFAALSGHPLELIWFPPGKGRAIWQSREALFLGIDHAAIAVRDTERSLRFYRDVAGMRVVGQSLNYGVTQEALSGVVGARVQITGLRYPEDEGAGVEFLEYLAPRSGREWAMEFSPRCVGRKMVVLQVRDLDAIAAQLAASEGIPGAVASGLTSVFGVDRGMIREDPSGHAVLFLGD